MQNFFIDNSLNAVNRVRRAVGPKWLSHTRFAIETPDETINKFFSETAEDTESRISLPFGLRLLKSRWLQSTKEPSSTSATETAAAASLISLFSTELAEEMLRPFFTNQSAEGYFPEKIDALSISHTPATPLFFNTVLNLARTSTLKDQAAIFSALRKHFDWLVLHKKEQDGLYAHGGEKWFDSDPMVFELRREISESQASIFELRSVAFNALIAFQTQCMARLAGMWGLEKDAAKYEDFAGQLADNITKNLWSGEQGCFMDKIGDKAKPASLISNMLTLAAEIPTRAQAAGMAARINELIDNLKIIIQCPEIAPAFLLIADGLVKYRFVKEAESLSLEILRYVYSLGRAGKYFIPRAVAQILLVREILGYNFFKDRLVIYPKLPEVWLGQTIRIRSGRDPMTICLIPQNNNIIDCVFATAAGPLLETTIENYSFKNFQLPIKKDGSPDSHA
ncbi:MAG TPA: trehalase family glycosidase [bacterium]|nr:trehalase family glycosidase [bacterium]